MPMRNARGFSMVEVLVVSAVAVVLGAVAVSKYEEYQTIATYKGSQTIMLAGQASLMGIREIDRKTFIEITGRPCVGCDQQVSFGMNAATWNPGWNDMNKRSWSMLGFDAHPRDGFGAYFIFESNEGEFGPTDCRHDAMWTAGEDNIWEGWGAGDEAAGDDLVIRIPFYRPRPGC